MHDPMTQAFQINQFWRRKSQWGYKPPLITIWHVDPETDGSDDSCGWTRPRLNKDQQARIRSLAGDESREPWFQQYHGKQIDSPTEAESLLRQAFMVVGKVFSRQHLCKPPIKPVTFAEASAWACLSIGNPVDNFRGSLAFLPGYHSNCEKDREADREYTAERFLFCIGAYILRERRPWYRHPRWHIWHWELQIHPWQQFRRWVFSRCCKCGKRFAYGESPIGGSWDPQKPEWFHSEKNIWHQSCDDTKMPSTGQMAGDVQPTELELDSILKRRPNGGLE